MAMVVLLLVVVVVVVVCHCKSPVSIFQSRTMPVVSMVATVDVLGCVATAWPPSTELHTLRRHRRAPVAAARLAMVQEVFVDDDKIDVASVERID